MFRSFMLLLNVSRVAIIWFGGKLVDSGNMPTGDLTAFLAYIMQLSLSLMMAVMMSFMIPRTAASAEWIQEVLQTPSFAIETSSPKSLQEGKKFLWGHHLRKFAV